LTIFLFDPSLKRRSQTADIVVLRTDYFLSTIPERHYYLPSLTLIWNLCLHKLAQGFSALTVIKS
jgi:hypothetical protein